MTYFGFLAIFIGIPLLLVGGLLWRDQRNGRSLPDSLQSWSPWTVIGGHVVVAVAYATPWDNYLVATRVWWYDPDLVTGLVIGWVPIEEYAFFVVQTLLVGMWLLWLAPRLAPGGEEPLVDGRWRWISTAVLGLIWLASATILLVGWRPGTYLGLELGWALPPIMLQTAFGADILWRYRKLVATVIASSALYLSATDALAIAAGTWTINPEQTVQIYLGGILPLEEFVFFLITSTLVAFGVTLVLARASQARAEPLLRLWRR
jgi:lycopene beta-cyclase